MKTYNRYYHIHIVSGGYTAGMYKECYERVGNWQTIKYTLGGSPYLLHNRKKVFLDRFYRFGSAWCSGEVVNCEDPAGRKATLHGYEIDEYYKPLFIELSEDGEKARLFRYQGSEEMKESEVC